MVSEAAWVKGACLPTAPTLAQLSPFLSGRKDLETVEATAASFAVERRENFPFNGPKEIVNGVLIIKRKVLENFHFQ